MLVSPVSWKTVPGGLTGGATPVPIPNTEVKPSKADDTAAVRQWESRTLPGYKKSLLIFGSTGSSLFVPPAASTTFHEEIRRVLSGDLDYDITMKSRRYEQVQNSLVGFITSPRTIIGAPGRGKHGMDLCRVSKGPLIERSAGHLLLSEEEAGVPRFSGSHTSIFLAQESASEG